jgi:hypothetical protein
MGEYAARASLINQRQPPSLITTSDNESRERERTRIDHRHRAANRLLALARANKTPSLPKNAFYKQHTRHACMHAAGVDHGARSIYTHLHAQIRLESREQESSQHCCCINVIKMMRSAQNSLLARCVFARR